MLYGLVITDRPATMSVEASVLLRVGWTMVCIPFAVWGYRRLRQDKNRSN